MDETERLSALVGDIYDAALDPTLWPRVVEKPADLLGVPQHPFLHGIPSTRPETHTTHSASIRITKSFILRSTSNLIR